MSRYPSIDNLYAAEVDAKGRPLSRGPQHGFQRAEFAQIGRWLVTEKVDGTNIRVIYSEGQVFFRGRTDNAQLHPQLIASLERQFTTEKLAEAFPEVTSDVILYGEGYGSGIQKAGNAYGPEKDFILFDVFIEPTWWLSWDNVVNVAEKLGIKHVPCLGRELTLDEAKELVHSSELLPAGSEHIEGIVLRTDPYLQTMRGDRVVAKYKVRDLPKTQAEELQLTEVVA